MYVEYLRLNNIYFQEETDTRVVLHLQYAEYSGFKDTVVRSPDTDIFFILLQNASSFRIIIHLDTGTGKHHQLTDVTALAKSLQVGSDYATALMGLYVYTREDCNSAFKSKGKVAPLIEAPAVPKVSEGIPGFLISLGYPRGVVQHTGGVYLPNVWKHTYQDHQRTPGSHVEEDGGGKRISCPQSPKWISPAFRHTRIDCLPILIESTTGCVISRNHMFTV